MKRLLMMLVLVVLLLYTMSVAQGIVTFSKSNSGLLDDHVNAVYIDSNAVVWFGTDNGICSFNGSEWNNQEEAIDLHGVHVNEIDYQFSSFGDELWFATTTGAGVGAFEADAITSATRYTTENSDLDSDSVTAVHVDNHNARWLGTANAGVSVFAGSDWYSFTADNDYLTSNRITAVASGPDSFYYIGTLGGSVSRLKSTDGVDAITSASPYSTTWSGIFSANVYSILVQDDGDQWFGTDNGLMFHDTTETKKGWHRFSPELNNVADLMINTIALDEQGLLWVGTPSGLSWVDTKDVWAILLDEAQFTTLTVADGLPDNNVLDIAVDPESNDIWIATANGVAQIPFSVTSVEKEEPGKQVNRYQLLSNYPNPFNPSTTIAFEVPFDGQVSLDVYNVQGQRIRRLANARYAAGFYTLTWNGLDAYGAQVNSGVYFVNLNISNSFEQFTDSHKILLVK